MGGGGRRFGRAVVTGALLFGVACSDDDDPTAPTTTQVAGGYVATKFTTTTATAGTVDLLANGSSLTAEFATDGNLTGHLTVPVAAANEDFAGKWRLENGDVVIEQLSNPLLFLGDVRFDVVGNTLVGDKDFSGFRVQLTLTKSTVAR